MNTGVTQTSHTLPIIQKSFNFTDKTKYLIITLYKSLVRPMINTVWGLHYTLDKQSIESVQRQFTKYLFDFNDILYSDLECLSVLGLPSL